MATRASRRAEFQRQTEFKWTMAANDRRSQIPPMATKRTEPAIPPSIVVRCLDWRKRSSASASPLTMVDSNYRNTSSFD